MDLVDEFEVPLAEAEAWKVLTDLERVAPCLPGAQLDEIDGEEYRGRVRVKVGPITVEYKGTARFTATDEAEHVAELLAEGRESRGQGAASAKVRATLSEVAPGRTRVVVTTTLDVSGKVAQLGRGVLADVSTRLIRQFVENLERDLLANTDVPPTAPKAAPEDGVAKDEERDHADGAPAATGGAAPRSAAPLSAARLIGPVLVKRLAPAVVLGALVLLFRRIRARTRD
jgi:uncharacterized protein